MCGRQWSSLFVSPDIAFNLGNTHYDLGAAASYLEHLTQRAQGAARVLVSNLDNGPSLGMIATLFPAARIIRLRRQPLDLALAWYFQNRRDLSFSFSLDDIAAYYLARPVPPCVLSHR
jgi:hypothetical protein